MSNSSDPLAQRILEAAIMLFARHGFQRTSMADVAVAAGVSRATLYLRFGDKRALFDGLARSLVTEALAAAETVWNDAARLSDNLENMLLARDLKLFRLNASPHGAELLSIDATVTSVQAQRLAAGFATLLQRRAEQAMADGFDLAAFAGPEGLAQFLSVAGAGLKHEARSEEEYRESVRRLCIVAERAMLPR